MATAHSHGYSGHRKPQTEQVARTTGAVLPVSSQFGGVYIGDDQTEGHGGGQEDF